MLVETPLHDYRHYPLHASSSVVTRVRSRQETALIAGGYELPMPLYFWRWSLV